MCHVTHDGGVGSQPLWNHASTQASHTLYSSPTLAGEAVAPTRTSLLCLSCHDGTVAVDSFNGATGSAYAPASVVLGTDLSDDHPVSISYAIGAPGLRDPHATPSGLGGSIEADLLEAGRVECSSCHDVHGSEPKLLRASMAGSQLCLTCHEK